MLLLCVWIYIQVVNGIRSDILGGGRGGPMEHKRSPDIVSDLSPFYSNNASKLACLYANLIVPRFHNFADTLDTTSRVKGFQYISLYLIWFSCYKGLNIPDVCGNERSYTHTNEAVAQKMARCQLFKMTQ